MEPMLLRSILFIHSVTMACALTCRSGSLSLRQLNFASLDLALHSRYTPGEGRSVFDDAELKAVVAQNSIMTSLPEDR